MTRINIITLIMLSVFSGVKLKISICLMKKYREILFILLRKENQCLS